MKANRFIFILSLILVGKLSVAQTQCDDFRIANEFTVQVFQLESFALQTTFIKGFDSRNNLQRLFGEGFLTRNNLWNISTRSDKYEAAILNMSMMSDFDPEVKRDFALEMLGEAPAIISETALYNILVTWINAEIDGSENYSQVLSTINSIDKNVSEILTQVEIFVDTPLENLTEYENGEIDGIINGSVLDHDFEQLKKVQEWLEPISKISKIKDEVLSIVNVSQDFKEVLLISYIRSALINEYSFNRFLILREKILASNAGFDPALTIAIANVEEFYLQSRSQIYWDFVRDELLNNAEDIFNDVKSLYYAFSGNSSLTFLNGLVKNVTGKALSPSLLSGWAIGFMAINKTVSLIIELEADYDKYELSVMYSTLAYHLCTSTDNNDCEVKTIALYGYAKSFSTFTESIPNPTIDWLYETPWELALPYYEDKTEELILYYKSHQQECLNSIQPTVNSQPLTFANLDPLLEYSVFQELNNPQKGFQIQVFDSSNELIYNSGLVNNPTDNFHTYSAGSYSGYDATSDDVRLSESLSYGSSYTWRVRYIDTNNDWRDWSDLGSFSIATEDEVFNIEVISPNTTKYSRGQTMNISWNSALENGTEYEVRLLNQKELDTHVTQGTTNKSIQWSIPDNQDISTGYTIEVVNKSNQNIRNSSNEFEITESASDYDLAVWDFEMDENHFQPGSSIDFSYKIWNSGEQSVSNVDVAYVLRNANTGEVIESSGESISSAIAPKQLLSESGSINAPQATGFYNLELTINYDLDFKAGNNSVIFKVYVGTSNPYQTYVSGSSDLPVVIGSSSNIAGFNVFVDAADENTARVRVNSGNFEYMTHDQIYFFEASQLGLIYKGKFDNTIYFRYYIPTTDLSFDPVRVTAEAGKTTTIGYQIVDDDPKQTIKFFEEANGITDQNEVLQNWSLSSKVTSTLFNEGELSINVPSGATRQVHSFWIEVDGNRFIQNLEAEVINPVPNFDPQISRVKLTTGPDRTETISISAIGLDGFGEQIKASVQGLPSGVSSNFLDGDRVFEVGESITLNLTVDPSFNAFDQYSFDLNLSSDTRARSARIFLDIVDPSENFLSINSVSFIDSDARKDSLVIKFSSDFSLAPSAITTNWQYWNGSNWIDIPEAQIFDNTSQLPGNHEIVWRIPSGLIINDSKFRMKNKSGTDFFSKEGEVPLVDSDHDYSGITIKDDIIYVLDSDNDYGGAIRVQRYDATTGQHLGYKSISNISGDSENQLMHAYGYFYVVDIGNDRIARFSEGSSSFTYQGAYNYAEDEDCLVRIGNDLYIFYYEHALDISRLIKLNSNLSKGSSINLEYSNAVRSKSGLFFKDTIWVSDHGSTWYKFGPDYQYNGTQNGISGDGFEYYNKKIYSTRGDGLIQIYSAYDPYSFHSESESFEINATFPPKFIGSNSFSLNEDQEYDTVLLASNFMDRDTDISSLEFEFSGISDGLLIEYDTANFKFAFKPKKDIDTNQSFTIYADDGNNIISQHFEIQLISIDDNGIPIINGEHLVINEDDSVKIPFDSLFFDSDSDIEDLQFKSNAYLSGSSDLGSISLSVSSENQYLLIKPSENEYGDYDIEIEIVNSLSDSTFNLNFTLEVLPINDPPSFFNLINPIDSRLVAGETVFEWEQSNDPEGDQINYNFIISIEGSESMHTLSETSLEYSLGSELIGKTGFWQVIAVDGQDETFPLNNYGVFEVVSDSSELFPFDEVIKEPLLFYLSEDALPETAFANIFNYLPADLEFLGITLSDNSNFQIDLEGYLHLVEPVDFELQSEFLLDIHLQYEDYDAIAFSDQISISIIDVNEPPELEAESFEVVENSIQGFLIGTLSVYDPEDAELTYSIVSGNDLSGIELNQAGELLIADSTIFDFETNGEINIEVNVSDSEFDDQKIITIQIVNVNEVPEISDVAVSIDENLTIGTLVVDVDAYDPDGDDLTYSIIMGNELGAFEIDNVSGEITVLNSALLDFETNPEFRLSVKVNDFEYYSVATIVIKLNDIEESFNSAPNIEDDSFLIYENSPVGTLVGTVTATDEDNDDLEFTIIGGNNLHAFEIDPDLGELTVYNSELLDFETNPVFNLIVQASDGELSDNGVITIQLSDINDTYELVDSNANGWFGGDDRSEYGPRNLAVGQSIYMNNDFQLENFSVAFSTYFDYDQNSENTGHPVILVLNLRNENGVIINTISKSLNEDFNGGWVNFVFNTPEILHQDRTYIFTWYLKDGLTNDLSNGSLANSLNKYEGGVGYVAEIGEGDNDDFYNDFTIWEVHEWDFLFKLDGIVINSPNEAPSVENDSYIIDENLPVGTLVGTVRAADPDFDDLIFKIASGNEEAAFQIDNSGKIIISDSTPIDYEINRSFKLTVEVSDGELVAAGIIDVFINDLDEGSSVLSVDDVKSPKIYPNPVTNFLKIDWKYFKSVSVYNLSGKKVYQSNSRLLDLSNLVSGSYMLLISSQISTSHQFVIIKD